MPPGFEKLQLDVVTGIHAMDQWICVDFQTQIVCVVLYHYCYFTTYCIRKIFCCWFLKHGISKGGIMRCNPYCNVFVPVGPQFINDSFCCFIIGVLKNITDPLASLRMFTFGFSARSRPHKKRKKRKKKNERKTYTHYNSHVARPDPGTCSFDCSAALFLRQKISLDWVEKNLDGADTSCGVSPLIRVISGTALMVCLTEGRERLTRWHFTI